jgi:hypothetical protein
MFSGGQVIRCLEQMVKVNQVEPLEGSLEPGSCRREMGVVVYLWHQESLNIKLLGLK